MKIIHQVEPGRRPHAWGQLRSQYLLATAIALVGLPYVLLTNTTAQRVAIFLHAFFMWLFLPPSLVICERVLHRLWPSRLRQSLWLGSTATLLGLVLATILMLLGFRAATGISLPRLLVPNLVTGLLPIYTSYLLVFFYQSLRLQHERILRLEIDQAQSSWQALSAQIQPHFLFNSLNSIECLVDEDARSAKKAITDLARLYRLILENSEKPYSEVGRELDLVRTYLAIQQIRFGSRLQIDIACSPGLESHALPANILLTLIENAVKHGIESYAEGGTIRISIAEKNGYLLCSTRNPCRPQSSRADSLGYGLRDVRKRLELLYQDSYRMKTERVDDSFVCEILLPKSFAGSA